MKKAACVLIMRNGYILAVSRKDDLNAFGLPGGKVEEGESLEEAAIREAKEETGIDVYDLELVFMRICEGEVDHEAATFTAKFDEDKKPAETATEETGRVAWVKPHVLLAGPFGDYNRALFETIGLEYK